MHSGKFRWQMIPLALVAAFVLDPPPARGQSATAATAPAESAAAIFFPAGAVWFGPPRVATDAAPVAQPAQQPSAQPEPQQEKPQPPPAGTKDEDRPIKPEPPPPPPLHMGVKATVKAIGADFLHLPSKENAMWTGIGGALAAAVHPLDTHVNRRLRESQNAPDLFLPGKVIGNDFTLIGGTFLTYGYGRITGHKKLEHLGMDLLRALAVQAALTGGLKYAVGRERPNHMGDPSFPSGHAGATFAVATVIERHVDWKYAIPGYLVASYVAASRLHDNVHYLSDVVFGAAVGIISGRTVTRHGRAHFELAAVPLPGGGAVMFTRRTAPRGARADEPPTAHDPQP